MSRRSRAKPWWLDGRDRPSIANVTEATMDAGARVAGERFERLLAAVRLTPPVQPNRGRWRVGFIDTDEPVVHRVLHDGGRRERRSLSNLRAALTQAYEQNCQAWLVGSRQHFAETLRRCA